MNSSTFISTLVFLTMGRDNSLNLRLRTTDFWVRFNKRLTSTTGRLKLVVNRALFRFERIIVYAQLTVVIVGDLGALWINAIYVPVNSVSGFISTTDFLSFVFTREIETEQKDTCKTHGESCSASAEYTDASSRILRSTFLWDLVAFRPSILARPSAFETFARKPSSLVWPQFQTELVVMALLIGLCQVTNWNQQ